jgi:hypothetical protein
MAWKAWFGFLLNAGEQGFAWSHLIYFGKEILYSPLRSWAFALSILSWGILFWRSDIKLSKGRFENSLFWLLPLPLYFLWIVQYTIRGYNVITFDLIAVLFAFSCFGYLLEWVTQAIRDKRFSFESRRLMLAIALSVFVPVFRGEFNLYRDLRNALSRMGEAVSSLDQTQLQNFTQGRDPNSYYDADVCKYLTFANDYSNFRFPTAPSDTAQKRQQQAESLTR